ncbi:hypothetical protein ART_3416 [Arthrobacter sp. PAMC 25486]|uniref:hypothetical protein n=1 Tax=Arthrobacter sp. PAMC 25486 TaxID=1494608 RepID=UPI000535A28B|nr:hypothetical protein [Arthrobacter sp. PAMC 25486]AIY03015.1 hypothetical protein ART_3416 [Arthrobacter sp. PAMC 25486]
MGFLDDHDTSKLGEEGVEKRGSQTANVRDPGLAADDPRQLLFGLLSDCGLSIVLSGQVTADVVISRAAQLMPILRRSTHIGRGFLKLNQDPNTVWTAVEGSRGSAVIVFCAPDSDNNLIFKEITLPLDSVAPPLSRELVTLGSTVPEVADIIDGADIAPVWEQLEFRAIGDGDFSVMPASIRRAARSWNRIGANLYKKQLDLTNGDEVDIYLGLYNNHPSLFTNTGENANSKLKFIQKLVDTKLYSFEEWDETSVLMRHLAPGTDHAVLDQLAETMANDFVNTFADVRNALLTEIPSEPESASIWARIEMTPAGSFPVLPAEGPSPAGEFSFVERVRESYPEDSSAFDSINRAAQTLREERGACLSHSWRNDRGFPLSPSRITVTSASHDSKTGRIVAAGHPAHEMWDLPPALDLGAIDGRNLSATDEWPSGGLLWPANRLYIGSSKTNMLVPFDCDANVISVDLDSKTSAIATFEQVDGRSGSISIRGNDGRRRFLTGMETLVGNEVLRFSGDGEWLLLTQGLASTLVETATGRWLALAFGNAAWWPGEDSCLLTIVNENGASVPRLFSLETNEWIHTFPAIELDTPLLPDYSKLWMPVVSPDSAEVLLETTAGVTPEFQHQHGTGSRLARVTLADGKGSLVHDAFLDGTQTLERDVQDARWIIDATGRRVRLHPQLHNRLNQPILNAGNITDDRSADTAEQIVVLSLNKAVERTKAGLAIGTLMPDILASLRTMAKAPEVWERQSEWLVSVHEQVATFVTNGTVAGSNATTWKHFCRAIAAIQSKKVDRIDPLVAIWSPGIVPENAPVRPAPLSTKESAESPIQQYAPALTDYAGSDEIRQATPLTTARVSEVPFAENPAINPQQVMSEGGALPVARRRSAMWLGLIAVVLLSLLVSYAIGRSSGTSPAPVQPPAAEGNAHPIAPPAIQTNSATEESAVPAAPTRSFADSAYCRGEGTLVWIGGSATFRGAFCKINGNLTYIGLNRDLGGTVTLDAIQDDNGFTAVHPDATYRYTAESITVTTATKTFDEPTTVWLAADAPDLNHPGDLGLEIPITYPACDDSAIVVFGTAWDPGSNAEKVQTLLQAHPGASYLRTDLSCASFTGPSTNNSGGQYIYAVYDNYGHDASGACQLTRSLGTYGRWLNNARTPAESALNCN